MNKILILAFALLFLILLVNKINSHLVFFGDIGWFYLQARDMLVTGEIPLVSIPSSHPWLHQGPFWTYLLGLSLLVGNFHPLSGGYLAVGVSVITLIVLYIVIHRFFSHRIALLSLLFYITSPLIIIHSRMPYHTTPIPLFTLCYLFSLLLWVKKGKKYFPLIPFFLAILYNFELATVILSFHFLFILLAMFIFKRSKIRELLQMRTLITSLIAGGIPLLPMIIYDLSHGFPQTLKFIAWLGYRALSLIGFFGQRESGGSFIEFLSFSGMLLQRFLFQPNFFISILLFGGIMGIAIYFFVKGYREREIDPYFIIGTLTLIGVGGYVGNHVTSEAYTPMLFPSLIICLAILVDKMYSTQKFTHIITLVVVLVATFNVLSLFRNNYFMAVDNGYGPSFTDRQRAMKQILSEAKQKPYNLIGVGEGSQFESFTMNYEYLGWYLGNPPSEKDTKLKFKIRDTQKEVVIRKE